MDQACYKKGMMGSRNPAAKLTEKDIPKIREMIKNNVPDREIAKAFGVSPGTINSIKRGVTWVGK